MSTLNSANSMNFQSTSNSNNSNFLNNSAPKKNLLFRTISQSDQPLELQRQDSVKMIDSLNTSSGYFSSQNSSSNSTYTPESTNDQIVMAMVNGTSKLPNTNNLKLLSELSSAVNSSSPNLLPSDQQQNNVNESSNTLKRKSMDMKLADTDFKLNTNPMAFQTVNGQSSEKDCKFIGKMESNILPNSAHKKMNGHSNSALYQDIQQRASNGNKIISLIQNEMFYSEASSSTKTNGFGSPSDLNIKSRSSSSSNDDIVTSSDQNMGNKLKPK